MSRKPTKREPSFLFEDPWTAEQRDSLRRYLALDRCVWAWVERTGERDGEIRGVLSRGLPGGTEWTEVDLALPSSGPSSLAQIQDPQPGGRRIVFVLGLDAAVVADEAAGTPSVTLAEINLLREATDRPSLRWVFLVSPRTLHRLREFAPDLYRFGQHFDLVDEEDLIAAAKRAVAAPGSDLRQEARNAEARVRGARRAGVGGVALADRLCFLAGSLGQIGESAEALAAAQEGVRVLGKSHALGLRAQLIHHLFWAQMELGRRDEAQGMLRELQRLVVPAGEDEGELSALRSVAASRLAQHIGDRGAVLRANSRALGALLQRGDNANAAIALMNLAMAHLFDGEVGAAADLLQQGEELNARSSDPRTATVLRQGRAMLASTLGDMDAYRDHLSAALSQSAAMGAAEVVTDSTRSLMEHLAESCRLRAALDTFHRLDESRKRSPGRWAANDDLLPLADLGRSEPNPTAGPTPAWLTLREEDLQHARHAEASGDLDRARQILTETEAALRERGYRLLLIDAQVALARRRRLDGDLDAAADLLDQALVLPREQDLPRHLARVLAERALLRSTRGRHEDAIEDAREAFALARRIRARRTELIAQSALGAVLIHAGRGAEGEGHAARARRFLEAVAAPGLAAEIHRGLASLAESARAGTTPP